MRASFLPSWSAAILFGTLISSPFSSTSAFQEAAPAAAPAAPAAPAVPETNQWVTSLSLDPSGTQIWATMAQGLLLRAGQVARSPLDAPGTLEKIYETPTSAWAVAVVHEANSLVSIDYKGKLLRSDIGTPNTTNPIEVPMRWARCILPVGEGRFVTGTEDGKLLDIHLPDGAVVKQWDGHKAAVHNIVLSPDKALLASAGGDGLIKIWNRADGAEVKSLAAGKAAVWDIVFTRDGSHLVSADSERRLNLYEVASGKLKMTLQMLPDWGTSISLHPTENVVAVACMNGSVHFYDLVSQRRVGSWNGVGSGAWDIMFTPDGSKVLVATRKHGVQSVAADVWTAPLQAARAEAAAEAPPAPAAS